MSMIRTLAVAAIFVASVSGIAQARDQVITARLAAPAAESQLIADNAVWTCEGDNCVARVSQEANVRACRQFAREAGVAVTFYGVEGNQLSSDELARCNADIAPQTQQARN